MNERSNPTHRSRTGPQLLRFCPLVVLFNYSLITLFGSGRTLPSMMLIYTFNSRYEDNFNSPTHQRSYPLYSNTKPLYSPASSLYIRPSAYSPAKVQQNRTMKLCRPAVDLTRQQLSTAQRLAKYETYGGANKVLKLSGPVR